MIQKTNAAYLELDTYTSRYKKSQTFVHTSQRLDMCSASHTADVETIIASDTEDRPELLFFVNASFLLDFLVPGVNEYSAGWFHVKLCAKCSLHSCYGLFLR
jgi:hypothetical protein